MKTKGSGFLSCLSVLMISRRKSSVLRPEMRGDGDCRTGRLLHGGTGRRGTAGTPTHTHAHTRARSRVIYEEMTDERRLEKSEPRL